MALQRRQESSLGLSKMPSYSLTDCLLFFTQKKVNAKAFSLNEACRYFQTHLKCSTVSRFSPIMRSSLRYTSILKSDITIAFKTINDAFGQAMYVLQHHSIILLLYTRASCTRQLQFDHNQKRKPVHPSRFYRSLYAFSK